MVATCEKCWSYFGHPNSVILATRARSPVLSVGGIRMDDTCYRRTSFVLGNLRTRFLVIVGSIPIVNALRRRTAVIINGYFQINPRHRATDRPASERHEKHRNVVAACTPRTRGFRNNTVRLHCAFSTDRGD